MQGKVIKLLAVFSCLLAVMLLSACFGTNPPKTRFTHSEDKSHKYETYSDFDIRELGEQVEGYWTFYNENEKEKKERIHYLNTDGIYYEGSYRVGKEIPKGEYFMLSMDVEFGAGLIFKEGNQIIEGVNRFGYVTIDDASFVNLNDCILISLEQKPHINPIRYQGKNEGKGKLVFPSGMYKVGVDLPIGDYKIKNELYREVTDISYEGYHGNESSYYPGYWNRCGLMAENEEQAKRLGWLEIELDSYVGSKNRYLKIIDPQQKISYQAFDGLPTVTFTEKDIGNNVKVLRSVLIPEPDTK